MSTVERDRWTALLSPLGGGARATSDLILHSWERSDSAGVQPDAPARFRRVDDADLRTRQDRNRQLIDTAIPHLEWLTRTFSDVPHAVYVADADGIVLASRGDAHIIAACALAPGFDWSESQMGTNGAGTAIKAGVPVAVIGCDHWVSQWHSATCLGAPLTDASGTVVGAIDISMAADDARPERLSTIAHVAFTIGEQFRRKAAEDAAAAKAEVIAVLSHEMRQPLTAAIAAVRLLEARPDSYAAARPLATIARQMRQMHRLVDDLLIAGETGGAGGALRRQRLNVQLPLEDALDAVRPTAAQKNVRIVMTAADQQVTVDGDRERLEQVFVNVLANAVKYTPPGGNVTVAVALRDGSVVVGIADSGIGMESGDLSSVFELFRRGSVPTAERGLGIGLTVARRLVELHGGTIVGRSAGRGLGSEFTVTLPAVADGTA